MAAASPNYDNSHPNHDPPIQFTAQPYLPLSGAEHSASDGPRAGTSDARTAVDTSTICANPPTPASHQEPSPQHRAPAHCDTTLSETGNRGEVESDVYAVEEICRQLGQAELAKRQTGFGCPIARFPKADILG